MKSQMNLVHALIRADQNRAFEYYDRLRRVSRYIETNYAGEVGLREAARVAAMEYSAFSRFFRQKVGMPYSEWLTRIRLVKAAHMLQERDCTIAEVAFRAGFSEVRTFQRAFKRYTSLTPREFRALVRPDGERLEAAEP